MKKIFIVISLVFVLSACSDYDDNFKKNGNINTPIIDTKNSSNSNIKNNSDIKPLFLNVGVKDFKKELEKNDGTVIDLRTNKELEESGVISGAKQIDFYSRNFKEKLNSLDKNKKYLIYCRSGGRSSQTLGIMSDLGFKNIYELRGGMNDWLNNGEKTVPYMNDGDDIMMNSNKMMNNINYKTITLNATSWKFDKPLLKFKKGEKVKIKINNIDKLHGIIIPGMRLQDDNEVIVDTSNTGEFGFNCLNYCGEGHKNMTGTIIIE